MHTLRTTILEHTIATGLHHDWLIEDPRLANPQAENARLWTARVAPPPQDWDKLKRFDLTITPPHRRIYLNYQGPVQGQRGYVRRLAQGTCQVLEWSEQRIVLALQTPTATLDMHLTQQAGTRWLAEIR